MKKIKLLVTYCILGLVPFACYAEDDFAQGAKFQCINKIKKSVNAVRPVAFRFRNGFDDYFCFNPQFKVGWTGMSWDGLTMDCFIADNDACIEHTTVCVLGSTMTLYPDIKEISFVTDGKTLHTSVKELEKGTNAYGYGIASVILAHRTCAVSYNDAWDNFAPIYLTDCVSQKWKKNPSVSTKNKMVMVNNSKPVLEEDKKTPSEFYVVYNKMNILPNICIGYYCPDANGKYTEPCDDGTCAPCKAKEETKPAQKKTTQKKDTDLERMKEAVKGETYK